MTFKFNEDLLQYIWEKQLFDTKTLKTTGGTDIQVASPGILNSTDGPDFITAKIKIGKIYHYGSVEIHINSSDWNAHSHQNNKNYNNVILHVCYNVTSQIYREDGTPIPALNIGNRLSQKVLVRYQNLMKNQSFVSCSAFIKSLNDIDKSAWIQRMAIERIEERCKDFSTLLTHYNGDWNQTFYTLFLRSFGMPSNRLVFEEIAKKLPYRIIQHNHESVKCLEGLVFGVAGLLNEDLIDPYYVDLKREWLYLKEKYKLSSVSIPLKFGRIRPDNFPQVRLAQFCSLMHHSPKILEHALSLPTKDSIQDYFKFDLPKFWDTHYTFKKSSVVRKKTIAKSFVDHLFVNAISPFVFYYEKVKVSMATDVAISYLTQTKAEQNSIINQWKTLDIQCSDALSTQGLLHLYKIYCKNKKCLRCNWGKKFLSRSNEFD